MKKQKILQKSNYTQKQEKEIPASDLKTDFFNTLIGLIIMILFGLIIVYMMDILL